jgi:hypothetical protein
MSRIKEIEEVLYWLEHTTLSRDDIIKLFREKLDELQTGYDKI